ncbi:hypothetical protein F5051DRAFT_456978 [Lentinula edodes]|nr:hypothetical protein F5051DRAFT_456978 [Lentinula edodes]
MAGTTSIKGTRDGRVCPPGWPSTQRLRTQILHPIRIHYSPANIFLTTLVPITKIMKFFAVASFCLLIIGATTVNAATDAEKACGFTKKVGTPCVLKLDGGHTLTGTCQKKSGIKVFRHRTCVPNSGATSTGADSTSSSGAGTSPSTSSDTTSSSGDATAAGAGSTTSS